MRVIVLLLLLAGCSSDAESVTISPKLTCAEAVQCRAVSWQLAIARGVGPSIEGHHVKCQCSKTGG